MLIQSFFDGSNDTFTARIRIGNIDTLSLNQHQCTMYLLEQGLRWSLMGVSVLIRWEGIGDDSTASANESVPHFPHRMRRTRVTQKC